jgi:hemerythrin-like domain-containing protein
MNTAAKNLEDDHVHILKLIDVMKRIIGSETPDVSHLESIVDIIRNFADGLHHAKEENQYFPYLAKRGFSLTQGPVAVMLHEHELGREYVKEIVENIPLYKAGNQTALGNIYRNMAGYAELLQNHISKENNILFRMADNALSETDNQELLKQFSEAEKNHSSGHSSSEYIERINKLVAAYGI